MTEHHPGDNPPPRPAPDYYPAYGYPDNSDEIDLFELFAALWRRKIMIAAVTAGFTLAALAYVVLLATPVYEVQARVRPPLSSAIIDFTEAGSIIAAPSSKAEDGVASVIERSIFNVTPSDALARFYSELTSRARLMTTLETLLEKNQTLPWSNAQLDEGADRERLFVSGFLPRLDVSREPSGTTTNPGDEPYLDIRFNASAAAKGADTLTAIIEAADSSAVAAAKREYTANLAELIDQKEGELQRRIEDVRQLDQFQIAQLEEKNTIRREAIDQQIEVLIQSEATRLTDQIKVLREAISIAEQLGIVEPVSLDASASGDSEGQQSAFNVRVTVDQTEKPNYLLGTRILGAELEALEKRRLQGDFVSPKIRDLQQELAMLDNDPTIEALKRRTNYAPFADDTRLLSAQIKDLKALKRKEFGELSFIRLDLPPIPPANPVKPKKRLVVAAATVCGGMLAALAALLLNARDNRRRQRDPVTD